MPTTITDGDLAGAALADDDVDDLDPRVRAYFRRQALETQRVATPEYQRAQASSRLDTSDGAIQRASLGGIAGGLAKLGTLNGTAPDVKPLTTTLSGLDAASRERAAGVEADRAHEQKRAGMNAKVYEYLQTRSDKAGEATAKREAVADEGVLKRDAAVVAAKQAHDDKVELARIAAGAKTAAPGRLAKVAGGGGKHVGSETATNIGNYDAALLEVEQLAKSYNDRATKFGSSARSLVPGTEASLHEKQVDMSAQAIGQILEGGKLTESDYDRYKAMLPRATDPNVTALAKLDALRRTIIEKKRGSIGGVRQAGYDVSNFDPVGPSPRIGGQASSSTPAAGTAIAAPASQAPPVSPGMPPPPGQGTAGKVVRDKFYSAKRNQTRLVYDDGSEEIVDGQR